MQKDLTLHEMTHIQLSLIKPDPLYKNQQFPKFLYSSSQPIENSKLTGPILKKGLKTFTKKILPPNHYLEHRFKPYLKVKTFKKTLFTQISKLNNCLSDRTPSNERFKTSKYPQVPLTKELIKQVESVNTYRKLEKEPNKTSLVRPCSQLLHSRKTLEANRSSKGIASMKLVKTQRKNSVLYRNDVMLSSRKCMESSRSFDNFLNGKRENLNLETIRSFNTMITPAKEKPDLNNSPNFVRIPYANFIKLFD